MRRAIAGLAVLLLTAVGLPAALASPATEAELTSTGVQPRATTYALTPLLTGGILETTRQVTLDQGMSRREKEPGEGCNSYADGQFHVTDSTQATALVDLGYGDVPRANPPAPTTILPADTKVSGSMSFQGAAWACRGDTPVLAQGGTCQRSFTPGYPGSLIEPNQYALDGEYYEPGVSQSVVGVVTYDPGFDCLMYDGEVPMAPGAYTLDYWGDAQYYGAFQRPASPLKQTKATVEFDMKKSDTSCIYGEKWWENQHSSGIYAWTGASEEYIPEDVILNCSSVRKGYARTSIERALVVNEVRIFQMTPSGDYAEVLPGEKFVDGNTVKIEMLVENKWKKDITAPIQLWDSKYKRKLEPEKGQQNPVTETFVAGAQKKVTFLWRTDGAAWETPGTPISGRDIDILTPYGGAKFTVFVKPRPALLVHGWNSSAATWEDWPGFVAGTRDGWYVKAVVGMNTDPENGNSIAQNAQFVARAIQSARTETQAVHVDLVVHSMGGLISRYYLSNLMGGPTKDGRPLVRTLTMFGTPHLGSDCATMILQKAASGLTKSDSGAWELSTVANSWSRGPSWTPTIQLTPAYLTGPFMSVTRIVKDVYRSHLSGIPVPWFACGYYGNQEGPNDGAVVLPSSIGGGLGGLALAAPLPVMHISVATQIGMTASPQFYDIALTKVLGLGPEKAPKLVATSAAPRADTPSPTPIARAVMIASGSAPVGTSFTLAKPAGAVSLVVEAPVGVTVTVTGAGVPAQSVLAGGLPGAINLTGGAGSVQISSSGSASGTVSASLADSASWFDVTTKRQGKSIVVTATIPDKVATTLQAVTVAGTKVGRVTVLKGKNGVLSAKLPLPAGDAIVVLVKGSRGGGQRIVATAA